MVEENTIVSAPKGKKQWYIANTMTGHENKVKDNLEARKVTLEMQDYIFDVIVAEREVPVIRNGEPTGKTKMKNEYPGYVFVEMIMSDDAWFVVRNTPGVTGILGSSGKGTKPTPVPEEQMSVVFKIVNRIDTDMYSKFQVGQKVSILSGPLNGSFGTISAIDKENNKATIKAELFGRINEVEVDLADIEIRR